MNKNRRITLIIIALPFVFGLAKAQDHSSYDTVVIPEKGARYIQDFDRLSHGQDAWSDRGVYL